MVLTFTAHNIHRVTKPTGMKKEHTGMEKVIASFTLGFAILFFFFFLNVYLRPYMYEIERPLGASVSLPSISPSISMCKLQRQHHMAPDSSHTFSTKQLNPCQREREREKERERVRESERERHRGTDRETETDSSASRAPICLW